MPVVTMQDVVTECLVLNLDKDHDKLRRLGASLTNHGVSFSRLPAVHGKSLSRAERRRLSSAWGVHLLPSSVIGCFASHRKAWELVVRRGVASCLILEDDADLVPDFVPLLRRWWREVPRDFDLVAVGNFANVGDTPRWHELLHTALNGGGSSVRVSEHVYRPSLLMGTHAYIVSLEGARKLLSLLPRADGHVDIRIGNKLHHLHAYGVRPALAYQADMGSSNIAGGAPFLLNRLAGGMTFTEPPLKLSLGWLLSEPLCKLLHDDMLVNGWTALFAVAGALNWRWAAVVLCLDFVASRLMARDGLGPPGMAGGYGILLLAVLGGHVVARQLPARVRLKARV